MEALAPYPQMRDSGIAWLGAVPAHWEVRRFRYVLQERDRRSANGDEQLLRVSQYTGVTERRRGESEEADTRAASLVGYKIVSPGELAVNIMLAWNGSLGVSPFPGIISPAYCVYRFADNVEPWYYHNLLRTPAYKDRIKALSRGVVDSRLRLYSDDLYGLEALLPPPAEQAAIVRFLDHADRRIRRYVGAKTRLIRLLEEQKAAIVGRAVTRGLNPTVPLKPSGVPWLGEIPAHWRVTRVKDEFHNLNPQRVPLSSTERGGMTLRAYDYYGASGIIDKVDEYLFDDDLLLIAEDGANLVLRNLPLAIVARGKFWVNNHAHILKPKRGYLDYLASFMECLDYRPWITGAAQPKLTQDRLMSIKIAVAPPEEQGRIMQAVRTETASLVQTIATARREIELLREYRIRLVSDVVTGKLDVREAAARLLDGPAEAEAPETDLAGEVDDDEVEVEAPEEEDLAA